ncbi:hypothetical protein SS50377_20963 [Spironucleus salmonicida]|nr:hypothetical protein SS50377_20963 [Spironucleus salmonicida]
MQYYPPHGYFFQYQFQLCTPSSKSQSRIVQNFSIDNILVFTSLEKGVHIVSVTAKMFPLFSQEKYNGEEIFIFTQSLNIEFADPSVMQAPCCVPVNKSISPLYHTPLMKDGQQIRIVMQPQLQKQKTEFIPPQVIPQVQEIDFINVKTSALGKLPIPVRPMIFSAWNLTKETEMYILSIGMVSGYIYSIKHQIKEGDKKFELKNSIQYQVENLPSSKLSYQILFIASYKDRQFNIISDNYAYSLNNLQKHIQLDTRSSDNAESLLLTSFGQVLVNFNQKYDTRDPYQNSALSSSLKLRIIESNGSYLSCLGGGVNTFLYYGYYFNQNNISSKLLMDCLKLQLDQNMYTSHTFADQKIIIATPGGVPLRSIDISSINNNLFKQWGLLHKVWQPQHFALQQLKESIEDPSTDEVYQLMLKKCPSKPLFRQLVRFTNFKLLDNGFYLVAAQVEEQLDRFTFLQTSVQSALQVSNQRKITRDDLSLLSACILLIKHDGEIINSLYLSDIFPETLLQFHFTQLQQPNICCSDFVFQKAEIPGFLNSKCLIHSQVTQFDATNNDVIIPLPLQGVILRIDLGKFSTIQENNLDQLLNIDLVKNDIILYSTIKPINHLAQQFKKLLGHVIPIALSRTSTRLYIVFNSKKGTEVMTIRIPASIHKGNADLTDILQEEESVSEQTPKISTVEDNETLLEPELIEEIILSSEQSQQASILGLLTGGFAVAWKIGSQWRVAELKTGGCVFASSVTCDNLVLSKMFG